MSIIAKNIEIDFTDDQISSSAGSFFLSRMANQLGLPEILGSLLHLKLRDRGACDVEMMLSLIYSLAQGDGSIVDVDRLAADEPRRQLLGLDHVPNHRRLGEYLRRFGVRACNLLDKAARAIALQVAPAVIEHEIAEKGYLPVFIDGSGIEVSGDCFEGTGELYDGSVGYWLHGVFIGGLWVEQRLWPGGVDVAKGWKDQLEKTADLIGPGRPVWARMDNAYYRGEVVEFCESQGWDYSISVTSKTYKKPLHRKRERLTYRDWKPINKQRTEWAALIYHCPSGWGRKRPYLVIRKDWDGRQKRLFPTYVYILLSRDDLPLKELARRHRGKQGQENAFKGPLIHLDLHHPPCRRFNANRAFYTAGQIAQLLLLAVQYQLLPEDARKHGIRTIIRDLVRTAGKLVRHARKWKLLFAKSSLKLEWIAHAADRVEAMAKAPP